MGAVMQNIYDNNNYELFRELVEEYGNDEVVNYSGLLGQVLGFRRKEKLPFLKYFPFKYLENVTEIELPEREMKNLDDILCLTNLKELDIVSNNITTLKGIENLNNLEKIWCYGNPLPKEVLDMGDVNDVKGIQGYYRTHD